MMTLDMLKDNWDLFNSLMDSLPFKSYIVDRELNIVSWNKRAEEGPYGVRKEYALGRPLKEVFSLNRDRIASPRDMDGVNREFREVFEKGTEFRTEDVSVPKSGEKRYYQVTKTPLYLDGGSVSHVMTIIEDVTEKRRREASLIMKERLFSMRELTSGIAHQINNPLSIMMVCVESLLREVKKNAVPDPELAARFESYLELTHKGITRCGAVSNTLAHLGSREADEAVKVDINNVLTEVLGILAANRKYSGHVVRTDLASALPKVLAKESLLRQAFATIILNAFEAMDGPRSGTLTVSSSAVIENGGRTVMVSFADNGSGLDQAQVNRVFSPFLTSGGNSRVGLGLYMAHAIMTEHGGKIEVRSNRETGTVFTVKLPVDPNGAPRDEE